MKTTKQYLTGCTWCNATGRVLATGGVTISTFDTCPVCQGAKIVMVTEVTEGNEIAPHGVPIESLENPKIK